MVFSDGFAKRASTSKATLSSPVLTRTTVSLAPTISDTNFTLSLPLSLAGHTALGMRLGLDDLGGKEADESHPLKQTRLTSLVGKRDLEVDLASEPEP